MASGISYYSAKAAASLANPTSETVFLQSSNSAKSSFVLIKPDVAAPSSLAFYVVAFGRATTGTTSNFTPAIQFTKDVTSTATATTSITAANNTEFFAGTARSLATVTRTWQIKLEVIWDSTSKRLTGQSNGINAETAETAHAAISALTTIDLSTGTCGFVATALFGSTNASNVAFLDHFYIEVM